MEFPRLVYKSPSDHKLVEDVSAFDDAISSGWFACVPSALAKKEAPTIADVEEKIIPADDAAPTRDELEAKAKELDLKFDGRTTNKKLTALIEAKLAE